MMKNNKLASLLLRVGLAVVFMYAAVGSLTHPGDWIGYLPPFLTKIVAATMLLKLLALYEIGLSVWFLSNWRVRYAGLLAAATFAGIVLSQPSALIVTFRDIGLLFMALAAAALAD